jgi:cytochrome c peroxidase
MNYQQVKQAYMNDSFDLVMATQAQITKLEAEFERTGNEHGADWLQSRYDDMQEEMHYLTREVTQ